MQLKLLIGVGSGASSFVSIVFKAVFLLSRTTSVPLDCVHYHFQLNEVQDHEEEV